MENARNSILDCLIQQAFVFPNKIAFQLLEEDGGEGASVSFASLLSQTIRRADVLSNMQLEGKRALLVYEDVLEFIISFLICQYLGIIAVPVPYVHSGKQLARLKMIMADAEVAAIFCTGSSIGELQKDNELDAYAAGIPLIATDIIPDQIRSGNSDPRINEISFIQYTSGSTGRPKGVIISAGNLMHNQHLIAGTFGCTPDSIIFSWLPFHHDMGLIGNILHAIYIGCTCILMSPVAFVQNPLRWINALSRYKVTHSGGPNFAYDMCVDKIPSASIAGLDLSSWRVAYNGSEVVRPLSLSRFASHFKPAGFDPGSFFPCYGLAEATLLVAGEKTVTQPFVLYLDRHAMAENRIELVASSHPAAQSIVSSGRPVPGMTCRIISPVTRAECHELEEGEICLHGPSVTRGYWNKEASHEWFLSEGVNYFRTGDLGFLYQDQLFVHARLKEMLLINGRNIYPNDVEQLVAETHPAIVPDGVVLIGLDVPDQPVIIAEVKRTMLQTLDPTEIIYVLDNAIRGYFGFIPYDIVLTTPLAIPRTTSGKRQRLDCASLYYEKKIRLLGTKLTLYPQYNKVEKAPHLLQQVITAGGEDPIRQYLINIIESKVGVIRKEMLTEDIDLARLGLDSLRSAEIINCINKELDLNITFSRLMHDNSIPALVQMIDHMLWLKKQQPAGKEIIL